jgi:predicted nucleic acid-binding protein
MKDLLLDANVLVRFLVQDDASQGPAATELLSAAERGAYRLHLDSLAVAETVYVLVGRYRRNRADVVTALLAVIESVGVEAVERGVITDALRRFAAVNVDFADAWLAARAVHLDYGVASFDRDLDKFKDVRRVEPPG